jgi:hypothetical protein
VKNREKEEARPSSMSYQAMPPSGIIFLQAWKVIWERLFSLFWGRGHFPLLLSWKKKEQIHNQSK